MGGRGGEEAKVEVEVLVVMARLEREGAVMQQRGVPSLPSAVTTHGFVYNYALQNDL